MGDRCYQEKKNSIRGNNDNSLIRKYCLRCLTHTPRTTAAATRDADCDRMRRIAGAVRFGG